MATRAQQAAARFQRQVNQLTGPRMIRIVNEAIQELRDLVKTRYMGATRTESKRLARNTGKMEAATIATRAKRDANGDVSAQLKIGVPYASVHFGEHGKTETIIRPKNKLALTVPTYFAKGGNGRALFPAKSRAIKGKYVRNGVLYGQLPGQASKQPLFVLRSSVVVPVRVSVERDIQPEANRIMSAIVAREVQKIFGEGNGAD